jgi:hypothetical protein
LAARLHQGGRLQAAWSVTLSKLHRSWRSADGQSLLDARLLCAVAEAGAAAAFTSAMTTCQQAVLQISEPFQQ